MVKLGIIGGGNRGWVLNDGLLRMNNVRVTAVCDEYQDRADRLEKMVCEAYNIQCVPKYTDYKEVLKRDDVDGVIITTSWESHIKIAIDAMKASKYVGLEVGGAYSIDSIWQLVHTYEETKVPCMMLENCCYGKYEMLALSCVKKGLFGEIVHCDGRYQHDLREEVSTGIENRHYRFRNYLSRNCESYPTHELGPIAKMLDINRGNRMLTLVSMASKAAGLKDYNKECKYDFKQGDIITTVIKCANGETISLTLDTTLPIPKYSRGLNVRGTKGFYFEDLKMIGVNGDDFTKMTENWKEHVNSAEEYYEKNKPEIWAKYGKIADETGHGGADFMVLSAFIESIENKTDTPIDVYDTASWMCISTLSEQSISMGSMPVAIPDFTNGEWLKERKKYSGEFTLDF